jgi:hypothetical protein
MDCSTNPTPQASSAAVISGEVEMVRLCPPAGGNSAGQVDLTPAGDPVRLKALTAALSLPDAPRPTTSAQVCLTYGQIEVEILVKTTEGQWSAYLPHDSCSHWIQPLFRAIEAVRS